MLIRFRRSLVAASARHEDYAHFITPSTPLPSLLRPGPLLFPIFAVFFHDNRIKKPDQNNSQSRSNATSSSTSAKPATIPHAAPRKVNPYLEAASSPKSYKWPPQLTEYILAHYSHVLVLQHRADLEPYLDSLFSLSNETDTTESSTGSYSLQDSKTFFNTLLSNPSLVSSYLKCPQSEMQNLVKKLLFGLPGYILDNHQEYYLEFLPDYLFTQPRESFSLITGEQMAVTRSDENIDSPPLHVYDAFFIANAFMHDKEQIPPSLKFLFNIPKEQLFLPFWFYLKSLFSSSILSEDLYTQFASSFLSRCTRESQLIESILDNLPLYLQVQAVLPSNSSVDIISQVSDTIDMLMTFFLKYFSDSEGNNPIIIAFKSLLSLDNESNAKLINIHAHDTFFNSLFECLDSCLEILDFAYPQAIPTKEQSTMKGIPTKQSQDTSLTAYSFQDRYKFLDDKIPRFQLFIKNNILTFSDSMLPKKDNYREKLEQYNKSFTLYVNASRNDDFDLYTFTGSLNLLVSLLVSKLNMKKTNNLKPRRIIHYTSRNVIH
ncbi:MAG: hypothetical protein IJ743_00745 [Bacilli bacterium]|nr:hypothetical protein [Bacilli bacterium]